MAHNPYLQKPVTEMEITEGQGFRYVFAAANCQGWRDTQEDAHLAIPNFKENTSLFAVFDGHNGPEVARFVAHHFAEYLETNSSFKQGNIERGIEEVFMLLDEALMKPEGNEELLKYRKESKIKPVVSDAKVAMFTGCTGVVLLIKDDNYYCANVGDSRCLVARDGKALVLSKDHKPDMPEERARIEKDGGKVINGRVNGVDVSRAFGDYHLKLSTNPNRKEKMGTAWPHTKMEHAKLKSDQFLVLMCDGIWNSMDNQEVVNFVKKGLADKWQLTKICQEMIKRILPAIMPKEGIAGKDNMTVVLIKAVQSKPKSQDSSHKGKLETQKSRKSLDAKSTVGRISKRSKTTKSKEGIERSAKTK